jgi:histone deacetylase 1/2
MQENSRRVAYFLDEELAAFSYGTSHPLKLLRTRLVDELLTATPHILSQLDIFTPTPATDQQLTMYHGDDYVEFLKQINSTTQYDFHAQMHKYNVGATNPNTPLFSGLYEYCQLYTGASLGCAHRINKGLCDVAINWAGGATHAKKHSAGGFSFINDVVLTILELLKFHQRVLYLDLNIQHGDGVEEAFIHTNRVFTLNFHKYGDFFPGTGHIDDIGVEKGLNFALNVPLRTGLVDEQFIKLANHILPQVNLKFQPNVVVVSLGADTLAGDRCGVWNLTTQSHLAVVKLLLSWDIPTIILGGGGYTMNNTARCWAAVTAAVVNQPYPELIPPHTYLEHYSPDFLSTTQSDPFMENLNSAEFLDQTIAQIDQHIANISSIPRFDPTLSALPSDLLVPTLPGQDFQ